jgi:hypothetical protein
VTTLFASAVDVCQISRDSRSFGAGAGSSRAGCVSLAGSDMADALIKSVNVATRPTSSASRLICGRR